ncbi:DUF397 domain-containing protein [Actinomadura harenae]|uniref:DUF397 domain-containing protein n=1 Tax=Actinomadura harenae TaxID=2483351 RepID=A0A3M2M4T2_9ACTN|nr:DUF397 domain-containing protein [Actinomadura harenae]RMI44482.1 DUF397 domain-containing protein [Actinomadura harenae]
MSSVWRKSSHSSGAGDAECVEIADLGGEIAFRDSRAPELGHFAISVKGFAEMVSLVKRDAASI